MCVASTTALPPPTCTARREAGQRRLLAVVLLRGLYRPDHLQLFCFKACAGRIVRRLCLPATALFCRLCLPVHLCHPCLLPTSVCPRSVLIGPPVHFHVRRDRHKSCKDCPVGSYNTGLQWRPVHRFLTFSPCRVHRSWAMVSVEFVSKMYCTYECAPGMSVLAPAIYLSRPSECVC